MSRSRGCISLLLAFHVVAITRAAIPNPRSLEVEERDGAPPSNLLSSVLTPVLDWSAGVAASAQRRFLEVTAPIRPATQAYVDTGLPQRWNLFAEPMRQHRYIRFDYYIASENSTKPTVYQELVVPTQTEADVRYSYRPVDKALRKSVNAFIARLDDDSPTGRAEDARATPAKRLAPMFRYFNTRFLAQLNVPADRLVRTEMWLGAAPIPPLGQQFDPAVYRQRLDHLTRYRDIEPDLLAPVPYPAIGEHSQEVDVGWLLAYVYQP